METTDARAPFLVLAHHRSGSNFLNDLLQSHPHVECINEPFSMHSGFFLDCDLVPWSREDFDDRCLHRDLQMHATLHSFLSELRQYLLQSSRHRVIGFKETGLFGKLEWVKAFLPSLKIVFLKRDPRAIVSSVLKSGLTGLWGYTTFVPPAFESLFPGYVSRIDKTDAAMCAAELVAMSIAVRYELAERSIGLFEHKVVDLDEFFRDPVRSLEAVTDFLDVEPHPQPLSFLMQRQSLSRGGVFSSFRSSDDVRSAWRARLSPGQIEAIDAVMQATRPGTSGREDPQAASPPPLAT